MLAYVYFLILYKIFSRGNWLKIIFKDGLTMEVKWKMKREMRTRNVSSPTSSQGTVDLCVTPEFSVNQQMSPHVLNPYANQWPYGVISMPIKSEQFQSMIQRQQPPTPQSGESKIRDLFSYCPRFERF